MSEEVAVRMEGPVRRYCVTRGWGTEWGGAKVPALLLEIHGEVLPGGDVDGFAFSRSHPFRVEEEALVKSLHSATGAFKLIWKPLDQEAPDGAMPIHWVDDDATLMRQARFGEAWISMFDEEDIDTIHRHPDHAHPDLKEEGRFAPGDGAINTLFIAGMAAGLESPHAVQIAEAAFLLKHAGRRPLDNAGSPETALIDYARLGIVSAPFARFGGKGPRFDRAMAAASRPGLEAAIPYMEAALAFPSLRDDIVAAFGTPDLLKHVGIDPATGHRKLETAELVPVLRKALLPFRRAMRTMEDQRLSVFERAVIRNA